MPPQNLDAELSVLSAMLLAEGAIAAVAELLTAADFYRESHGLIYQAALDLYAKGSPVDALTMVDELEKRGSLERVGGRGKIHEIAAWVSAAGNVAHYARIVKETAIDRGLVRVGSQLSRLGQERVGEVGDRLEQAEQAVFALSQDSLADGLVLLRPALLEVYGRMASLAETGSDVIGLESGFRALDRITLGFQPGNLVILAARPSMGKSALAICLLANIGVRQQLPVAIFTLEMSKAEVAERLLAVEANVGLSKVRTGRGNQDEWARLASAAEHLDRAPIFLDDSNLSMVELRSRARRLKTQQPGLALLVVDYLGLLVRGKYEHRTAETGAVARQLKELAKDLKVPVIALAQLNRNLEMRADKRPVLSDLRDSGEIEQHADLVAFLYRDEVYNPEGAAQGVAELHIAKHRNGPTDTLELAWVKDRAKFTELHR